ncbi:MAG: hypothetical protein R3220_11845 [Balneolaceae bacterium]|nr:hypothetical protein [Balneolaceae bacterium]
MKDYIALIHIEGTPIQSLPKEKQEKHLRKVGGFIKSMTENGHLKNAQPFEPKGISIQGQIENLTETEITVHSQKRTGFYHISADSLSKAKELIMADPRFEDTEWNIEIWPILQIEGIN